MDAENKSGNGSDFEYIDAGEEEQPGDQQQSQFSQDILGDDGIGYSLNIVAEESNKIQQEKMAGLHAENVQLKAEVEKMKTEKELMLEKNSELTAKVEALQSQLGEMPAKQKVAELEAKQLAQEQIDKSVKAAVNEVTAKLREEFQLNFGDQLRLMKSEMREENAKMKKKLQKKQHKFNGQQAELAEKEKKLEHMAQQLEQSIANLREEMTNLKIRATYAENKQREFATKLAELEAKTKKNGVYKGMESWKINSWVSTGCQLLPEDEGYLLPGNHKSVGGYF